MEKKYMEEAIALAQLGEGYVSPNPLVGAVIVKNGLVIGTGYHERYGGLHAERNALANCSENPAGGEMYVTLEPCCHYGKTPPCTAAIIQSGISRVFVGSADPNPLVAGKGMQALREKGIEVIEGVLQEKCDQLNEVFFHYILKKQPFVVMKYACSADGKIATCTGESKWITGETARQRVHIQRGKMAGIMVGVGTVLQDDPLLNCRAPYGRQPLRIICDSQLRIPVDSQLVKTARQYPTLVAAVNKNAEKERFLKQAGMEVAYTQSHKGKVDLTALMQLLGARGIDSLLVEGGGTLHFSMLESGLVNRVQAYISPKMIGGQSAKTPVEGEGFEKLNEAVRLQFRHMEPLGEDLYLEMDVLKEGK